MTRANAQLTGRNGVLEQYEARLCCDFQARPDEPPFFCNGQTGKPCRVCPRSVEWTWSSFDDLPASALYAALRLRQSVFIVEQKVPYPDIDGRDLQSMHLLGVLNGELVAYLRLLPCGLFEPGYASFGRVVVDQKVRGLGLGRKLIEQCMNRFDSAQNSTPIKISSQLYLKDFYATFDFAPIGEPYIEDMIPHIAMIRH